MHVSANLLSQIRWISKVVAVGISVGARELTASPAG